MEVKVYANVLIPENEVHVHYIKLTQLQILGILQMVPKRRSSLNRVLAGQPSVCVSILICLIT